MYLIMIKYVTKWPNDGLGRKLQEILVSDARNHVSVE